MNAVAEQVEGAENVTAVLEVAFADLAGLRRLARLIAGRRSRLPFYVCTARDTLGEVEADGTAESLRSADVTVVVDTCVVVTPILPDRGGVLMTDSGKFAHYGPANTGYDVVYGSMEDCVESAVSGRLSRDEGVWTW